MYTCPVGMERVICTVDAHFVMSSPYLAVDAMYGLYSSDTHMVSNDQLSA